MSMKQDTKSEEKANRIVVPAIDEPILNNQLILEVQSPSTPVRTKTQKTTIKNKNATSTRGKKHITKLYARYLEVYEIEELCHIEIIQLIDFHKAVLCQIGKLPRKKIFE